MKKYVIALDAGTTSSRAMLIDRAGRPVASVQRPFPQIYPQPGWVEHDPQDILSSQLGALAELIMSANVDTAEIDSIGITNQRETTIVWDRRHRRAHHATPSSGSAAARRPWWRPSRATRLPRPRSRRARASCPTPTSPPASSRWMLGQGARRPRRAPSAGELCFGTVDSWLIWKLTGGAVHVTDCDQRQPHHALQHPRRWRWDSVLLQALRHSRGHSVPRCAPLPADLRRDGEPGARPGHSHLRRGGRPAGGALRPVLLPRGPGEEHLRHRLLSAHAHRARGLRECSTGS